LVRCGVLWTREPAARRGRPARPAPHGLRDRDSLGPDCRVRALPPRAGRLRGGVTRFGPYPSPMATAERDYYELLGVERGADDSDIKRAFRKLARELHPDVSDAPDAADRFKEIAEAYEVLSNPEPRELYDRYGHAGLQRGGFSPGHVNLGNLSDIFSAFFGDGVFGGRQARASRGADIAVQAE